MITIVRTPAISVTVHQRGVVSRVKLPGTPGPPGGDAWEMNVAVAGAVNGSNATFTTSDNFVPGTVTVHLNGLALSDGNDFITSGTNTIIMNYSPRAGATVRATYKKA